MMLLANKTNGKQTCNVAILISLGGKDSVFEYDDPHIKGGQMRQGID